MKNTFIDLADKLDGTSFLLAFELVGAALAQQNMAALVIGATARDLVMHYGYGAVIRRATNDIDFGVQVTSWDAYQALRQSLIEAGCSADPHLLHRLKTSDGTPIDLVPFGGEITNDIGEICWPPAGDIIMSVMGFQEAFDAALHVRVSASPVIELRVASPAGIALLKLISWSERSLDVRSKDAKDLAYLMSHYDEVPATMDRLYGDHADVLAVYKFNVETAGAWLLGHDVALIAHGATRVHLHLLLNSQLPKLSLDQLIHEMSSSDEDAFEGHAELLNAFRDGLLGLT